MSIHDKFDTNKILIEINDYINTQIVYSTDIDENIIQLKKLSEFLIVYKDIIDFNMCKNIIESNNNLKLILKNFVVNNNMDNFEFDSNIIYDFIDTYCTIENIKLGEIDSKTVDIPVLDDITKIYLIEAARIPLLTSEEEKDLLIRYANGDKKARKKLIESNLRLVISIAKHKVGLGLDLVDLIQEGNIGLMNAIEGFDVSKGFRFSTYATYCIKQTIYRAVYNQGRTIRLPIHVMEAIKKYERNYLDLESSLGRKPTNLELAEKLNMSLEDISKIQQAINSKNQTDTISLNITINDEDDSNELENFIADPNASTEDVAISNVALDEIRHNLSTLPKRVQDILILRYGLNDGVTRSLEEVATYFNLTRQRIQQIETKALRLLRIKLNSQNNSLKTFVSLGDVDIIQDMTIYSRFKDSSKEQVDELLSELTNDEKKLLTLRYGEDLEHPVKSPLWNKSYQGQYDILLSKLKNKLRNAKYSHRPVNVIDYPENNQESLNIYDVFSEYSKEQVDKVLRKLSPQEKNLINMRYSNNLSLSDNSSDSYANSYNFRKLMTKIRQLLQNADTNSKTSIYDIFYNYSKPQIDEVLDLLPDADRELLFLKYGMDFKNPIKSLSWNAKYEIKFHSVLLKKINYLLDFMNNVEERKNLDLSQFESTFNPTELVIILLKLGYVNNRQFSNYNIANFLGIDVQLIKETLQKFLNIYYQNNFNNNKRLIK